MDILLFGLGLIIGLLLGYWLKPQVKNQDEKLETLQKELAEMHRSAGAQDQIIDQLHEQLQQQKQYENQQAQLLREQLRQMSLEVVQQGQQSSEQQLQRLLQPFAQRLVEMEGRIGQFYQDENRQRGQVQEQLAQLNRAQEQWQAEALALRQTLRGDVQIQGQWGEWILEKLLESAGLQLGTHYEMQFSQSDEQGQILRPDCLLYLPQDRCLVIDAKVSLKAYERYMSNQDEKALKEHVQALKRQIQNLGKKAYAQQFANSPDFVLMFVPLEGPLNLALQQEPKLLQEALEQGVFLTGPNSLLPLIRMVAYLWKQEGLQGHVLEMARQGGLVHDQIVKALEQLDKLGQKIQQTERHHGQIQQFLGQNLAKQALQLRQLGIKNQRELTKPWAELGRLTEEKPLNDD